MAKRSEKSKEITKISGTSANWLAQYSSDDSSLAGMEKYVIVPRLKQIQGMSDQQLKTDFGEGSMILRPGNALVATKDDFFMFIPFFFFTEFSKRADRRDKENPMFMERTFDPNHEVARRAMNSEARVELYPGHERKNPKEQWNFRYVESLCFPGRIFGDHDLAGQEATLIFERGEFSQGRNFISAVKLRRAEIETEDGVRRVQAPLWSQIWSLRPTFREKGENKWWGLDFQPGDPPLIPSDISEECRDRHLELAKAHEERRLVIDGEPDEDDPEKGKESTEM